MYYIFSNSVHLVVCMGNPDSVLHASYFDVLYLTWEAKRHLQTLTLPQEHIYQHMAAMKMEGHLCALPSSSASPL